MHSVIAWILICILLFIASVALALLAIVRKKLKLFIAAIAVFFVFAACGVYTLVRAGIKVLGIANTTFALEDGAHIYERTWGKPGQQLCADIRLQGCNDTGAEFLCRAPFQNMSARSSKDIRREKLCIDNVACAIGTAISSHQWQQCVQRHVNCYAFVGRGSTWA